MNNRLSVRLILIFGVLAISGAAIFIRQAEADPIAIAFYRMAFAALLMVPWAAYDLRSMKSTPILGVLALGFLSCPPFCLVEHVLVSHQRHQLRSAGHSPARVCTVLACLEKSLQAGPGLVWLWPLQAALGGFRRGCRGLPASRATSWPWGSGDGRYFLVGRVVGALSRSALRSSSLRHSALFLCRSPRLPPALTGYSAGTWRSLFLLAFVSTVIGHTSLNWALKSCPPPW